MSGEVSLSVVALSASETDDFVEITILRQGDASQPVTVEYATTPDTATAADAEMATGFATIPAGDDRITVQVPIFDDSLDEGTESFYVSIIGVDSGTLLFPRTARIDILDDENFEPFEPEPPLVSKYDIGETAVYSGLTQPIAFEFSPDDSSLMYVAEKAGRISLINVDTGVKIADVLDITAKVNDIQDRGLMDIALHPDFQNTPYLYAFYVVDPPGTAGNTGNAGVNGGGNRFSHVVRYTLDEATGYETIVAGSETILLGAGGLTLADISGNGAIDSTLSANVNVPDSEIDPNTGDYKEDYLKVDSRSHAGGSLAFGPDGALYVSTGDGTSFNLADPRSVSVQDIDSLAGKILRVDPLSGEGLADNPFVDQAGGDLSANAAKVFQLGLRNPYSMGFDNDGQLFITSTGWTQYEQVFTGPAGANFGWPWFEGGDGGVLIGAPGYRDFPEAQAFYDAVNAGTINITAAYRAFSHRDSDPGFQVQAITGADTILSGGQVPASLDGHYIFTDVVQGEVFSVSTDDRRDVEFLYKSSSPYAPVHFKQGPDGSVYYADLIAGTIGKLDIAEKPTFEFGGSTYLLGTPGLNWEEARAEAEALGGKLVEIDSQAENDFITQTFGGENAIFIGFSDVAQEGVWVGADGQEAAYQNWLPGEPNNAGGVQDYARIAAPDGRWDDGGVNTNTILIDGSYRPSESVTVVEFDDDTPPKLSLLSPDNVLEGDAGETGEMVFVATLDKAASTDVSADVAVTGDATAPATVTIPSGQTTANILVNFQGDNMDEANETITVTLSNLQNAEPGDTLFGVSQILDDDLPASAIGAVKLSINENSNNVQTSNFNNNSFLITNLGVKDIAHVEIDVTNALFPDSVFDPFGEAGDLTSRQLTINTDGNTGVIAPDHGTASAPGTAYIGQGGIAGFEGIQLFFDENDNSGFNPGETLGFAVDMDPNSVAGAEKSILDSGAVPSWDVGGVSGAELIGSTFTVTFTDGTTATGQLQGNDNQAGAIGLATQEQPPAGTLSLNVNGLSAGGVGTYDDGGPTVIISGPAGETARIVLAKGIIQPVNNNFTGAYGDQLQAQLDALAASAFPANNAAEFQTVDIVLTGGSQDISNLFDFTEVSVGQPLAVNEAQVPLGFVASLIDPSNDNLPLGAVSDAIYLTYFDGSNTPPVATDDTATTDEDSPVLISGATDDTDADGDNLTVTEVNGASVTEGNPVALNSGALVTLNSDGTFLYDPNGQFENLNNGQSANDSFTYTISDGNGGTDTATANVTINGVTDTTPTLSLSIDPSSISENGGTATATLTRTGDTSSALTVTLSSDDTSEATVPANVVIEADQSSATFTVTAVNDSIVDGTQTPTITASATGFADVTANISVTDDDGATSSNLVVGIYNADTDTLIAPLFDGAVISPALLTGPNITIAATVSEDSPYFGGVGSVVLNLNDGQATRTESVTPYALFGDSSGNYSGVQDLLPDGSNAISFSVFSQSGGNGTLLDTILLNFTVGDGGGNIAPVAVNDVVVTDEDTSTSFDATANDFDANGDTLTITQVNNAAISVGVPVALSSGALVNLNGDGTFTYDPNGQFENLNDGDQGNDSFTYTISDGNGGEDTGTANVTIDGVTDIGPSLSLTLDQSSISEAGGSTNTTVTRTGDLSSPLTVSLLSDDTSEATVPNSVTIDADSASASFLILGVDDLIVDGTQSVTITASAQDFTDATSILSVTDDEVPPPSDDLIVGLYDADTDTLIQNLTDGIDILASDIAGRNVTISATVSEESSLFADAESLFLDLNAGAFTRTENVEPYALFGDSGGNFNGQQDPFVDGANSISIDVFSENGLGGDDLGNVTINFNFVDDIV